MLTYGSVCSGIEAATVAWHSLGWRAAFYSEIEPFPSALLQHYYPSVPNHGDLNGFRTWPQEEIDVLVGGTPCQSFSVAGLRRGLADPRGNLCLTFLALADRLKPRWLVWENVPGVLSSAGGRDFGSFLGALGQLGYGFAYRVLDAQYFGVPQRRRRVFVVGCLGSWQRAAAVLFESASLRGDSAPRRQPRERVAPTISARTKGGGGLGTDFDCDGGLIHCADVAATLNAHFGDKQGLEDQHINQGAPMFIAHSLRGEGFDASEDGTGRGTPLVPVSAPTLTSNGDAHSGYRDDNGLVAVAFSHQAGGTQTTLGYDPDSGTAPTLASHQTPAVAFAQNQRDEVRLMDVAGALAAEPGAKQQTYAHVGMQVRRLTPRECERLQGFPDDYTLVEYRRKPAADGPRYKALGNSMAVPVMAWIGQRIHMQEML